MTAPLPCDSVSGDWAPWLPLPLWFSLPRSRGAQSLWRPMRDATYPFDADNAVRVTVTGEQANLDQLPDRLCPTAGCHVCGAAFEAVHAFLLEQPVEPSAELEPRGRDLFAVVTLTPLRVEAVELLCCCGHLHVERRHVLWTDLVLTVGVITLAGLYFATKGRT